MVMFNKLYELVAVVGKTVRRHRGSAPPVRVGSGRTEYLYLATSMLMFSEAKSSFGNWYACQPTPTPGRKFNTIIHCDTCV